MFGRKKDSATITDKDPVFEARYIGSVETFTASGKGCALLPVQKLWENSMSERHLKKVFVYVSVTGLVMKENKKDEGRKFSIENITFCNADKTASERVFCWVWKVPGVRRLECHAVLCRSRETARAMALVLSRAFQAAYRDWRANKGRQIRQQKNSQLQEKYAHELQEAIGEEDGEHSEGQTFTGTRLSGGVVNGIMSQTSGENRKETRQSSNGILRPDSRETPGLEYVRIENRRASSASSTSGFASSVILDPEDEECIQADAHVQALVAGDVGDSDHGSE